ncbi:uncharacterized protein LOC105837327 [Monomorium pharaonis]|uniref:uncharacterized protein LOC105837327 n=1 Tax=Monomorium pharaonis TaxID=307658 RepID=UPI0017479F4D|nr:uncharacterized protein LOC105837327 [Monomorium pharaonis]
MYHVYSPPPPPPSFGSMIHDAPKDVGPTAAFPGIERHLSKSKIASRIRAAAAAAAAVAAVAAVAAAVAAAAAAVVVTVAQVGIESRARTAIATVSFIAGRSKHFPLEIVRYARSFIDGRQVIQKVSNNFTTWPVEKCTYYLGNIDERPLR